MAQIENILSLIRMGKCRRMKPKSPKTDASLLRESKLNITKTCFHLQQNFACAGATVDFTNVLRRLIAVGRKAK